MDTSGKCSKLGGWHDVLPTKVEKRIVSCIQDHLKENKVPKLKKIQSCSQKCVRGQLISIIYTASDNRNYRAMLHDDIDRLYIRSIEPLESISTANAASAEVAGGQ